MAAAQAASILEHIHKLVAEHKVSDLTDRELLQRFGGRDEAAFTELVRRHGPMVLRTCWHILQHTQDVEDAFQAAFLVLAGKAGTLRWRPSIASWLYEAAYRLALKARRTKSRTTLRESKNPRRLAEDPQNEVTVREAQALLHEEMHRLPEILRAPLIHCYLESSTQRRGRLGSPCRDGHGLRGGR